MHKTTLILLPLIEKAFYNWSSWKKVNQNQKNNQTGKKKKPPHKLVMTRPSFFISYDLTTMRSTYNGRMQQL